LAIFTLFRPSGDTSAAVVISGTVQGSATLSVDYTVAGFDTYTATAWSCTMPSGSSSKDVELTPTPDTLVEATESVFLTITAVSIGSIKGDANSILFQIVDNDATTLLRVVATGGTQLISAPPLSASATGFSSTLSGQPSVRYTAANVTAFSTGSTIKQNQVFDGLRCYIEFGCMFFGNSTSATNYTQCTLNIGGGITMSVVGNTCNFTGTGLQAFSVPVGHNVGVLFQIGLEAGTYYCYKDGSLVAQGLYGLNNATTDCTVTWSNGALPSGSYEIGAWKLTRGSYQPDLGVYAP
jgi:hypothetical protein